MNNDLIKKENWKKAPGIKYKRGMTNSALAPRDYSIRCRATHKITLIKGYWIWWCSTHHQPLAWCEKEKAIIKIKKDVGNALLGANE